MTEGRAGKITAGSITQMTEGRADADAAQLQRNLQDSAGHADAADPRFGGGAHPAYRVADAHYVHSVHGVELRRLLEHLEDYYALPSAEDVADTPSEVEYLMRMREGSRSSTSSSCG